MLVGSCLYQNTDYADGTEFCCFNQTPGAKFFGRDTESVAKSQLNHWLLIFLNLDTRTAALFCPHPVRVCPPVSGEDPFSQGNSIMEVAGVKAKPVKQQS